VYNCRTETDYQTIVTLYPASLLEIMNYNMVKPRYLKVKKDRKKNSTYWKFELPWWSKIHIQGLKKKFLILQTIRDTGVQDIEVPLYQFVYVYVLISELFGVNYYIMIKTRQHWHNHRTTILVIQDSRLINLYHRWLRVIFLMSSDIRHCTFLSRI